MRTRRSIPIGKPAVPVPAEDPRRKVDFPSPGFEPSGEEGEREGLPAGVRIRWFRNLGARPMVVAPSAAMPRPPPGAIVWTDEALAVDLTDPCIGAAAVALLPRAGEGARTLPEPAPDAQAAPTLREAVAGALAAVPEAVRAGASDEVERALSAVGL